MMYGWTSEDYRAAVGHSILRARVSFAVDTDAANQVKKAETLVKETDGNFAKVAEQLKNSPGGKVTAGQSGLVNNVSTFAGLQVSEVAKFEKGKTSGVLKSTTDDGYYFVKVVDKNDTQVNFVFLHVPLTKFAKDLEALKKDNKITEYVHINEQ
jgi:parvulin-like peptidyl-prolyl isomerase